MTACHKILFKIKQIIVIYSIPGGQAIMWYPFRISVLVFEKIMDGEDRIGNDSGYGF
jgi:hypothetical protein